jgi:hypothetical protein
MNEGLQHGGSIKARRVDGRWRMDRSFAAIFPSSIL